MRERSLRSILSVAVLTATAMVAPAAGLAAEPCPAPVPCTTEGPSCWAVRVKYHSNQAVGGQPEYVTHSLWVPGMAFELRTDAECAARRLATEGAWLDSWFPEQVPENGQAGGYLVPPSRLDAVTIADLYSDAAAGRRLSDTPETPRR